MEQGERVFRPATQLVSSRQQDLRQEGLGSTEKKMICFIIEDFGMRSHGMGRVYRTREM